MTKVATKAEIADGTAKIVEVDGKTIAVFNCRGKFYATTNTCPHRGGPVGEGQIDGATVTCPWHGWEFDVSSGRCLTNPAASIASFPVQIDGDDILVGA
jgi:NAD(P)H-dependent nitrite reductase small subunit